MSAHGVTMRKTREILRLRWGQELIQNVVAQSCNCSGATVHRIVTRAQCAGLSWLLPAEMDDNALEAKSYPKIAPPETYPVTELKHIHFDRRRKEVTLVLLWQEYRDEHPNGCGCSAVCSHYRKFRRSLEVTMRLPHGPGEKLQVDYAGDKMPVYDARTGEAKQVSIFVAAMRASQCICSEAVAGEDSYSWLRVHEQALEYLGGVPQVVVSDNLESAVTKASFYDPEINRAYKALADHYEVGILPARVRRPKDRAKVENAVLQV